MKPSQAVDASMRRPALTDRQKQVLTLIADGLSNKEIARALFIETKTVEVHAAAVKKKLKGRNSVHVAVLAIRLGLVSEPTEGEPS